MEHHSLQPFQYLSLRFFDGRLEALDQRLLPHVEKWLPANTPEETWQLIKELAVRGAPLIGVTAALCLAVLAERGATAEELLKATDYLESSRPTAVNLMHCCSCIRQRIRNASSPKVVRSAVVEEAQTLLSSEVAMNSRLSELGASLIQPGEGILTHCNTGSLATPGAGTALGAIKEAHRQGKGIHVYVDETRPLLQGGRLTTFELEKAGVPYTLICDNMAATLMRSGKIQRVLVGADRIAMNGDFANKIGTYSVAVLAHYHKIPFHTVAPTTTVDFKCETGNSIPIEERKPEEVRGVSLHSGTVTWAPENAKVFNPAFDVTPGDLVTSIILDSGIYTHPDVEKGVLRTLKSSSA